jgi:hypothetical protein
MRDGRESITVNLVGFKKLQKTRLIDVLAWPYVAKHRGNQHHLSASESDRSGDDDLAAPASSLQVLRALRGPFAERIDHPQDLEIAPASIG